MLARSLMCRCGKVLVAAPPATALGNDYTLVRLLEIVHQLAGLRVVHRGANRNLQRGGAPIQPGAIGPHAMFATLRFVLRVVAKVNESIVPLRRFHDHVATPAAIATRRPAPGDKFLAPERHTTIAAVAGFYTNFCFINEH